MNVVYNADGTITASDSGTFAGHPWSTTNTYTREQVNAAWVMYAPDGMNGEWRNSLTGETSTDAYAPQLPVFAPPVIPGFAGNPAVTLSQGDTRVGFDYGFNPDTGWPWRAKRPYQYVDSGVPQGPFGGHRMDPDPTFNPAIEHVEDYAGKTWIVAGQTVYTQGAGGILSDAIGGVFTQAIPDMYRAAVVIGSAVGASAAVTALVGPGTGLVTTLDTATMEQIAQTAAVTDPGVPQAVMPETAGGGEVGSGYAASASTPSAPAFMPETAGGGEVGSGYASSVEALPDPFHIPDFKELAQLASKGASIVKQLTAKSAPRTSLPSTRFASTPRTRQVADTTPTVDTQGLLAAVLLLAVITH